MLREAESDSDDVDWAQANDEESSDSEDLVSTVRFKCA